MHLVKDESGNMAAHPHGDEHTHKHVHEDGATHTHAHSHEAGHEHIHTHDCGCKNHQADGHQHDCDCQGNCADETIALLTYMHQHNEQHAQELEQMAVNLRKMGIEDAARSIDEGVSDFQKGNMRLSLALTLVRNSMDNK